nr:reverse transcriptase domain-containing protein [Tanacetum cinerariifolium]
MTEMLRAPTEGCAEAIVVPLILAEQFELKHSLINMMTSKKFFGLEKDNPYDHIRWFNKITSTIKYKDVPTSMIKLILFPFYLAGVARRWLKIEPPRSITTWDDLVSKFIIEFFPPSRTTNLRNEISIFQQKFNESFHEAWERYKDLLRACPHHGFTELHQLDTFYSALNPADQDSLNAAAGGNLLEKSPQDALTIIENKSKVRNSRSKPIASLVNACDNNSSSEIAKLTYAVNQQTSAVTTAMTAMLKQLQSNPPSAQVKTVKKICDTCGGAHPYYQCLAAGGNTFLEFWDNIQGYVSAATCNYNQGNPGYRPQGVANQMRPPDEHASTSGSGSLPGNTIANSKGELKSITTRSGLVTDGPTVPIPPKSVNPEKDECVEETYTDPDLVEYTIKVPPPPVQQPKPPIQRHFVLHTRDSPLPHIPYPSRMLKQKQQEKDDIQIQKFWTMFKQLHLNITLAEALVLMPKYQKMLKALLSNKEKLQELANTPLNENCSAVILKKLPEKLRDHWKFLISCGFSELKCKALADLGASINLMPLSVWKKLGLPDLIPTRMTLKLANRAICTLEEIARDVFVLVGEEMILHDGDERLTLNMKHDTASYSNHPHRDSSNLINIFNISSEYCLEDLVSNKQSGNPTFSLHKEIASPKVTHEIHDSKGCNLLSKELPDIDSFNDIHPHFDDDPLSGSTTYSANSLLEEFTDELALITYPPDYDDNHMCDIESDLKEIEFLLYQGEDSDFKDSIDQSDLANLDDLFVDPTPEMFTDEQPLDYSFPPRFDVYPDDFLEIESDANNFDDDLFDSKGEKIKESELLIDQLDLPCDILLEYDSFNSQDFSRDDDFPSPDNEDKVFNLGILIHEKLVIIITRVAQEKKLAVSYASLMFEDFDPPFYELLVFKEVPNSMRLLLFSSKNEEKVFKPGIYTYEKVHFCFLPELSHPGERIPKKDKIRSKPNKNRKRGEAGKSQRQLQSVEKVKLKKTQKERPNLQSLPKFYKKKEKTRIGLAIYLKFNERGQFCLELDHSSKVLSMQEDDSEVQEVVEVVTTAKLITEVVTATASQVSAASATIPAIKPSIPAAAPTVVAAYTRRRKGVIIRDLEEELPLKTSAETPKVKDKGKGILVETPKPMKKKDQIELDAEYAKKLHGEINKDYEEFNKDIDWDAAMDHVNQKSNNPQYIKRYQGMKKRPQTESEARKNMMIYLKNTAGYKMDFFKGMTYAHICPIFQARFDENMRFLFKSSEEMEEEDQEIIKSINKTPAQKAAKRRKLSEEDQEADDLRKRLKVVEDEDDDVFVEATPLASKVPVVDYRIVLIDNKPRFKIIRADESH